jgi:hypothetical protein
MRLQPGQVPLPPQIGAASGSGHAVRSSAQAMVQNDQIGAARLEIIN